MIKPWHISLGNRARPYLKEGEGEKKKKEEEEEEEEEERRKLQ